MSATLQPALRALENRVAAWALRRQPPAPDGLRLGYRLVYILPTRFGVLYTAFTVLLLVIALHYNNSMVFAFDFLLAGLGANAMWLTHRNLLNLRLQFANVESVFAGSEAAFRLSVENPTRLPRRALELQCNAGPVTRFELAPQSRASVLLRVPAQRRGPLRPGRFTVRTEYPLGLFRAWSWIELDMEGLVWPAPVEAGDVLGRGGHDARDGRREETRGNEDFAGIRPYQRGDALHHLAWKAMAHLQEPHTKAFSTPEGRQIWIDWADLPACPVEERLSRLCALVLEASAAQRVFGLRIPGTVLEPDTGPAHERRCLDALARFGQAPD